MQEAEQERRTLWGGHGQCLCRLTYSTHADFSTAATSGSSRSLPVFVTMGSGSNVKLGPGGTPIVTKGQFFAFMKDRFDFPLSALRVTPVVWAGV